MISARSRWAKIRDWFDERSGILQGLQRLFDEPIRGGASWAYIFGSALLFLFVLQALTGVFLAMYYVPSADHAHASVAYIQKRVPGGELLRGLHHYGASAMVILAVMHLSQTFLFGAYKGKRELLWGVGVLLFLLTLVFAFTGYLLPWDQAAYFGTKVGTSIVGEIPALGQATQRILLAGAELTTLTLSRFFMIHVFLLPAAMVLLVALHLHLFRRAGPAGPFQYRDDHPTETFYPNQLFRDAIFILLVFVILFVLTETRPAELGPMTDPTSDYLARPAWYFLPLFQLLKYFPGQLSLIPIAVLPATLIALLVILPFVDGKPERNPFRRPVSTSLFFFSLASLVGLIYLSRYQDQSNPEFRVALERQGQEAERYLRAPFRPQDIGRSIPIDPPQIPHPTQRTSVPLKIYFANCANCHGASGAGGPMGPSLVKIAKRRGLSRDALANWIQGHMREPAPDSMPRFEQLTSDEVGALADWLITLNSPVNFELEAGPSAAQDGEPPAVFAAACGFCHGARGEGNIGPSLIGISDKPRRTPEDLLKLLKDSRAYGLKDPMPRSFPTISEKDRIEIVNWLEQLKAENAPTAAHP